MVITIITIKIIIKLCTWNLLEICSLINPAMKYEKKKNEKLKLCKKEVIIIMKNNNNK